MTGASSPANALPLALLIASTLHAMLIFGVSFDAERPRPGNHPLEVTLLLSPSAETPQEARHVAAAHQEGRGQEALREYSARSGRAPAVPADAATALDRQQRRDRREAELLTARDSRWRLSAEESPITSTAEAAPVNRDLALIEERLRALEARMDSAQPTSGEGRVRRIDAVAATSAEDAAYLAAWRQRVEAVGNRYYPEASRRYGVFGRLRLLVSVHSDGRLAGIEILQSSGQRILDDAAVRIVRMAAPFPPFPAPLRATTDRLDIVRTWQFEQNPLSSG
jgi:protein TonB